MSNIPRLAHAAVILILCACTSTVSVERTDQIDVPVSLTNATALDIETRNGAVSVVEDASATRMRLVIEFGASGRTREDADARVHELGVQVDRTEDGIHVIRATAPGGWRSGDRVEVRVTVPSAGSAILKTSNGRASIEGAEGDCILSTSNGSVTAQGIVGDVKVDTSNGAVKIFGQRGAVDATSSNGSIRVELADGDQSPFFAQTTNGSVHIEVGSGWQGKFSGSTSNGRVEHRKGGDTVTNAEETLTIDFGDADTRSTASTSNGSIRIEVRNSDS